MKWSVDTSLRQSLVAFALSRFIVFAVMIGYFGLNTSAPEKTSHLDRPLVTFSPGQVAADLRELALIDDAGWYHDIAVSGYEERQFDRSRYANWAFFPFHPLIWSEVIKIAGDDPLFEILISNLLFLLALVVVHKVVTESGRNAAAASRTLFVLALFPTSYFFSMPWSESLFLLLSVLCFFCAQKRWLVAMATFGALACATRITGIFLIPNLIAYFWQRDGRVDWRIAVPIAALSSGLLCFMVVLWGATGNPLAFSDIQSVWGRHLELPIRAIGIIFVKPWELAVDWNFRYLNLVVLLLACLTIRHLARKREFAFVIFLGLSVAVPLLTGNITSLSRYVMVLFPFAVAVGDWLETAERGYLWFTLSTATLVTMTLAFAAKFTFAGT